MWCDAILVLIQVEWPKARAALLDPETRSATASVQSWMQASYVQVPSPSNIPPPLFLSSVKPECIQTHTLLIPFERTDCNELKCADLSLQALLSSRAAQRSGVPSLPDASDSVSADAAKHMVQAVQQFVAVLQIQTVRLVTLTPFDASNYGRLHACPIPPSSQPHKCVVLTIPAMKT